MADITKCTNNECVLKENCGRYLMEGSEYQPTIKFEPTKIGCNFFIEQKRSKSPKSSYIKKN
jgi:hypothetical protein